MACFSPLSAYKTSSGEVVFHLLKRHGDAVPLSLACGQCVGCRLERSRQWAMRVMHEAQLHRHNCFVTLTFDERFQTPSLQYKFFQDFMKRLRWDVKSKVRFYMCGEYGENNGRPHFHACLFGYDFPDKLTWKRLPSGSFIYRSAQLERLWPHGFSSVGELTFESAAYVARYCMKKITGPMAKSAYAYVSDFETGEVDFATPEFNRMSLKPGIGADYFNLFKGDIYPHDEVIVNGKSVHPPKYYDKLLKRFDRDQWEFIKANREEDVDAVNRFAFEARPERVVAREINARARLSHKVRTLE